MPSIYANQCHPFCWFNRYGNRTAPNIIMNLIWPDLSKMVRIHMNNDFFPKILLIVVSNFIHSTFKHKLWFYYDKCAESIESAGHFVIYPQSLWLIVQVLHGCHVFVRNTENTRYTYTYPKNVSTVDWRLKGYTSRPSIFHAQIILCILDTVYV